MIATGVEAFSIARRGDGQMELLVGQFNQGKIRVYNRLNAENFAPGEWLMAEAKVAEVRRLALLCRRNSHEFRYACCDRRRSVAPLGC